MKKTLLFIALAAGMLLASCTKTIVTVVRPADESPVEQKLIIGVSSGKDALTTKAGRPLLSEAAGQNIDEIKLYFVASDGGENGNVVLVKTVDKNEWANAVDHDGFGKQIEVTLKASNNETLNAGTYKVYAVGYSTGSYHFYMPESGSWSVASFYATPEGNSVDEIFAGEAEIKAVAESTDEGTHSYLTTSAGTSAKEVPSIVLNRQVAGITGYFTNIPAKVNGVVPAKVRLVASRKYDQLNFISLVSDETTTNSTKNYVVNGSKLTDDTSVPYWNSSNKGYVVYDIDLSKWFNFGSGAYATFDAMDINQDGYVGWVDALCHVYKKSGDEAKKCTQASDFTLDKWATDIEGGESTSALSDFWKNPNNTDDVKQQLVAGSVFAGKFVIPFDLDEGINTLELQVVAEDGTVLRNWNVQVDEPHSSTVQFPTGVTGNSGDVSKLIYNIYRNHMYSLGSKGLTIDEEGGNPGEPEDPDYPNPKPDPDEDGDDDGERSGAG